MKVFYCFQIVGHIPMETAWEELEQHGIELAYSEEEETSTFIYGYWNAQRPLPVLSSVAVATPSVLPSIDWEAQWATHGLDFRDGYVHVDLSLFGSVHSLLRLQPGPGFGDVSHPTTRLVLRLLAKNLIDQETVDVGCGSGILTLAAVGMGSPVVYGIDIDPLALEHAHHNAMLNQMEKQCCFCLPSEFQFTSSRPLIVVMNMILSEQQQAWNMLPTLQNSPGLYLTSGIRKEERTQYIEIVKKWGWKLVEEIEEEEWQGFAFERQMERM